MCAKHISEKTSERLLLYRSTTTLTRALTALVLALGLFGCDAPSALPAPPTDTLRIVSSMPSKGYAAPQARQIEQAIDLAIREPSSTAAQWHVEHIALSDSDDETGDWSAAKEASNAKLAAADPSVIAYIGPYNSGAAAVSLPVTNRAGLLQVIPSATWPGLSEAGWNSGEPDTYFPTGKRNLARLMPADTIQARAAVEWALQEKKSHIVVLNDGSSYSVGLAQSFTAAANSYPDLVGSSITVAPSNLADLPGRLADSSIFYAPSSVANAVALAKALQATNTTVFATDTALDSQFSAGAASFSKNWLIVSNSADYSDLSTFTEFSRRFEAAYGGEPSQFAANAYDATNLILDELKTNGNNRAAITAGVLDTSGYQGVTGSLSFDQASGERTSWRAVGYRLKNGLFEKVAAFSSTSAP
jgi:branched-chain amino acid transport system substrate-binding protein